MSAIKSQSLSHPAPAIRLQAPRWHFSGQQLLTYVMLILLVIVVVGPFLWMLVGSFRPTYEQMQKQGTSLWIEHPTTENYSRLFAEYDFARYFLNSTFVATMTAIF